MNRREFLKTSGAVSAALGLANSVVGAGTGMFLAINTSLVGGKVQWPEVRTPGGEGGVRRDRLEPSPGDKKRAGPPRRCCGN
jgi:hypothetical protein